MFDSSKTGKIEKEKVRTILNTLGHTYDDDELDSLLAEEDGEGKVSSPSIMARTKVSRFMDSSSTLMAASAEFIIAHGNIPYETETLCRDEDNFMGAI
jgi:hypothetical protein